MAWCRRMRRECPAWSDFCGCGLLECKYKKDKVVAIPTYNVSLGQAVGIVKSGLDDDTIALQTKVLAIEKVANMETHNSITKDDLVNALRWLYKHYDFES